MTQQEVIKTFMHSLDETTLKGSAALNEAIKASSNFKSFKAVRTQFLNDLQSAKNWQTFLVEKCGIVLDNTDTGAISGSDAGGSEIKTATDILPSKGKLLDYPTTSSVTIRGMTLYGIPPKDSLTEDQQYIVRGLISWWLNDALKLIEESYGISFTEEGSTGSRLKLQFMDDDEENSGLLAYVSYDTDDKKIYEATTLCVNMANFQNMSASDHHGSTGDGYNLDRTLVHELVHGVMVSNVDYAAALPGWLIEGGTAELIHGIDDERHDAIIEFVKDVSTVKKVLTTKSIEDYKPDEIYEGGYVFMRYFAKQAGTDTTFDYDTYRAKVSVDANNFAVNYFDTVTIYGGSDADTITNSGANVSIFGGKGNDTIKNYSDTVTINGGGGNDSILNEGANVKIYGGKENDYINNENSNVTISGGNGNDSIENEGSNVFINGGSNNDSIDNRGAYSTIDGGSGNDSITNSYDAKNSTVDGGSGNDLITNSGANVTVLGGTGNDSITNNANASNVKLYGDAGKDKIINYGSSVTVYGGDGKDTVTNYAENVTIYGDAGNDKIINYSASTWVQGGDGNDSILNDSIITTIGFSGATLKATNSTLRGGNGNDSITNTMDSVSVYGDDGNDYIYSKGDKLKLYGGNGDDLIYNYQNKARESDDDPGSENTVYGGAGNDSVISYGDSSRINLGSGDDSIQNFADLTSITGSSGNDYIYSSGAAVTLSGGSGNDSIYNEGYKATIFGGSGNDTLHNEGNHVTLSGGKGNDSIVNDGGAHITYNFGSSFGKDIVTGFNDNDTVQITSGKYSSSKSGSNVIVKVGKSILTLVDAVGKKINFISSSGVEKTKTYTSTAARWFNDDTNIATSNDLSSIVKSKSDVATTNLTTSLTSLTDSTSKTVQLTYGGKKS